MIKRVNSRKKKTMKKFEGSLEYYLAGLLEGDGTIHVPKVERSEKGLLTYPKIEIVFHLHDFPLALLIVQTLEFGRIHRIKGKNAYVLVFSTKEAVFTMVNLLNGKFRTPKINALHKLIKFLNLRHNLNIPLLPLDASPLCSNSWLSGFAEADSCFYVRATISNKRIATNFSIEQKRFDKSKDSCYDFMKRIADFFQVPLTIRKSKGSLLLRATSFKSTTLIQEYFKKYPLFGVKYLNYLDYEKVFELIKTKDSLSKEEFFDICKKIKSEMNDRRSSFSFDHLQYFYKKSTTEN